MSPLALGGQDEERGVRHATWEKSTAVIPIDIYDEDSQLDDSRPGNQERLGKQSANRSENRFKDSPRGDDAVDDMVMSGVSSSDKSDTCIEAAVSVAADYKIPSNSDDGQADYSPVVELRSARASPEKHEPLPLRRSQRDKNAHDSGSDFHDDSTTEGTGTSGPDSA